MKALLLALCAAALFHATFAQRMPVQRTISTPYGDRALITHVPGESTPSYADVNFSGKYEFTIIMKDDSAFVSKTKIDHREDKHSVTIRDTENRKKIIYPPIRRVLFGLTKREMSSTEFPPTPAGSSNQRRAGSTRFHSSLNQEWKISSLSSMETMG